MPKTPDTPKNSRQQGTQPTASGNQVRNKKELGEPRQPSQQGEGQEGGQNLPETQHQKELGQADQLLEEPCPEDKLTTPVQQDHKTEVSGLIRRL